MSYPEATTKPGIQVKEKLSLKYMVTNLGLECQLFGFDINGNGTWVSLGMKA
jgi:hypothetical protein